MSLVILQQGYSLLRGALRELMDAGVSDRTLNSLAKSLQPLLPQQQTQNTPVSATRDLLHISALRAKRSGTDMFVDLTAHVSSDLSVTQAAELEENIRSLLTSQRSEIKEIRVKFLPVDVEAMKGKAP